MSKRKTSTFKWKDEGLDIWDVRKSVIHDLVNTDLTFEEIAQRNSVSFQMVRYANSGANSWTRTLHSDFPIREGFRSKMGRAYEMVGQGFSDEEIMKATDLDLETILRAKLRYLKK